MNKSAGQTGFSLTEVLLATGVLAVGFALVATVFPVGMMLTSAATERSIGPVAAQEAAAKIQLYGLDLRPAIAAPGSPNRGGQIGLLQDSMRVFDRDILNDNTITTLTGLGLTNPDGIDARLIEEAHYPSLPAAYYTRHPNENRRYMWTALCRKIATHNNPQNVELRLFICRIGIGGSQYYAFKYNSLAPGTYTRSANYSSRPMPIPVVVRHDSANPDLLTIAAPANQRITTFTGNELARFFVEDAQIVDDKNGQIYRILERQDLDDNDVYETLVLDTDFTKVLTGLTSETVWVVPPARGGGRNPCIGIYSDTAWIQ